MNKGFMEMEQATIEMYRYGHHVGVDFGSGDWSSTVVVRTDEMGRIDDFRFIESPKPSPIPPIEMGRDILADIKRSMHMACKKKGKGRGK